MYQENSHSHRGLIVFQYVFLAGLLIWGGLVLNAMIVRGSKDFRTLLYILAMCSFWCWLYAFSYTVEVEKDKIRFIRHFFIWKKLAKEINIDQIEVIMDTFKRTECRALGIRGFKHFYSWTDGQPTRVLVFKEDFKSKNKAVLFRGTEDLMDVLGENFPKKIVEIR